MLAVVTAGRPDRIVSRWLAASRIILVFLVLCHLIGVCATITASSFASQSAALTDSFARNGGDRYANYDKVHLFILLSLSLLITRRPLAPSTLSTRPFKS